MNTFALIKHQLLINHKFVCCMVVGNQTNQAVKNFPLQPRKIFFHLCSNTNTIYYWVKRVRLAHDLLNKNGQKATSTLLNSIKPWKVLIFLFWSFDLRFSLWCHYLHNRYYPVVLVQDHRINLREKQKKLALQNLWYQVLF